MLDRNQDMMYSGMRHPFLGEYTAGFTKEGILDSLELDLFCNGGYSTDLSIGVSLQSPTTPPTTPPQYMATPLI